MWCKKCGKYVDGPTVGDKFIRDFVEQFFKYGINVGGELVYDETDMGDFLYDVLEAAGVMVVEDE